NKRYIVEVEADNIQLLGRKPDSAPSSGQQSERYSGSQQSYSGQANQGQNPYNNGNTDSSPEDFSAQSADDLPF
ncbi:MAG TPA: hypothetical protein PKH02_13205, partial [Bacteroidales bacterium]|nr:hypothetical protein [Bacteroidales bacterium]